MPEGRAPRVPNQHLGGTSYTSPILNPLPEVMGLGPPVQPYPASCHINGHISPCHSHASGWVAKPPRTGFSRTYCHFSV